MSRSLHNVWPGIVHVENQIEGAAAKRDIDAGRVEAVGDGDDQLLPRRIPDQATAEGEIGIGAHPRGERVQQRPPVGVDGRQVGGTELDAERIAGDP